MKKWWILAAAAAALIGLQACAPKAQDECGFVQNVYGERISWKTQYPVVMKIHSSVPDDYVGAIKSAAATWNEAAGKTLIQIDDGKTDGTAVARDHVNVISFSSSWESDKLSEQAKTSVHWVGDQIQEADIKVNASASNGGQALYSFYWAGTPNGHGVNIEALVLHEMGHVLGLKHRDSGGSVMATYLASNADRVNLAKVDKDSLMCEY